MREKTYPRPSSESLSESWTVGSRKKIKIVVAVEPTFETIAVPEGVTK